MKDNLKTTFNGMLATSMISEEASGPYVAVNTTMAASFIEPIIDALATPRNLALMMNGARPQAGTANRQATQAGADRSMSYESFNRFVVTVKKKGKDEKPVDFAFNRDGMFFWKLSAIRPPMPNPGYQSAALQASR